MTPDGFSAFSLVEWVLFGFIFANLALIGLCLAHNGLRRLNPPAEE